MSNYIDNDFMMLGPLEEAGFEWSGIMFTCGLYRIRESNFTFYLEKFYRYYNRRAIYKDMCSLYTYPEGIYGKVDKKNLEEFKNEVYKAVRHTKMARLNGILKKEESHYRDLHHKNKY